MIFGLNGCFVVYIREQEYPKIRGKTNECAKKLEIYEDP